MTPQRWHKIQQVLAQRQPDLTVLTDHVHKGRNLSAIVRTCDAVGIQEIHTVVGTDESYKAFLGTAMGSHQWVDVRRHLDLAAVVSHHQAQGFQIIAAHPADHAHDFRAIDYTKPTALLLGAEKVGVSEQALALVDEQVVIPMMGMVASLNVSVAAAIILTEVQRQRQRAGLYQQSRLSEAKHQELSFRWGYPRLARFCEQRNIAYPQVDDNGDVIASAHWRAAVDAAGMAAAAKKRSKALR